MRTTTERERIIRELDESQSPGVRGPQQRANKIMRVMHERAVKAVEPRDRIALWYLKFVASITPAVSAAYQRRFSEAFDWIIVGLSDDLPEVPPSGLQQGAPRLDRLSIFVTAGLVPQADVVEDLSVWGAAVLYTSRASGAFREWLPSLIPFLTALLPLPTAADPKADLAIELAEWLLDHDAASPAVGIACGHLIALAEQLDPTSPIADKAMLALQSRVGRAAGVDRTPYAAKARKHPSSQCRFQVATEDYLQSGDIHALLTEIVALHEELRAFGRKAKAQNMAVLFRVIHPVLVRLVAEGRHADAVLVLATWRNGSLEPRPDSSVLLWMPHLSDGHSISWRDGTKSGTRTTDFEQFIAAVNEFRGTNIAHRRTLSLTSFRDAPADRPDLVLGSGAAAYERIMRQMLTDSDLTEALSRSDSMAVIPCEPHPVQPILASMGANPLPWSASLRPPANDRVVQRVAIIATDSTADGVEVPWLLKLARRNAVQVEHVGPEGLEIEVFRGIWERDDLDVVWVTGHGEFNAFQPTDAGIPLAEGAHISFLDLASWRSPTGGRRLVVLNVCYGAMVPFSEGLGEMGGATMLAGPSQAVVAHLWNSEWRLSAVFGSLLFAALLRGEPFFSAYRGAITLLRDGAEAMAAALRDLELDDAADRVKRSGLAFDELQHWGSPAFFQ